MPSGPINLHIADVLTAVPAQAGVEAGMVMLTEDEAPYRSLRIIIGQPEANAIMAGWHGAVPGRPSTWDLFVSAVALLGARLDRVVITAVQEERHYFAHLELEHDGERRILACRPSDAIALAVRAYNVEILAEPPVLDAAGVMPDGSKPGQRAEEPPDEPESLLADREAALAAREAELAERERAIAAREHEEQGAAAGNAGFDSPVGNAHNHAPAEEAPTAEAPTEQAPTAAEQAPTAAEQAPALHATAEEALPTAEHAPALQAPALHATAEEALPTAEAPALEAPAEQAPALQVPTGQAPTEEAPAQHAPKE